MARRPAADVRRRSPRTRGGHHPGAVTADLGCGPGSYLPHLARPTVALDAAFAMLPLAREAAPDAWAIQADLEALPFRRAALGAAWARASYLHVRTERLPAALADLHRALVVGAPATLSVIAGDTSGPWPNDDFPGRWFAGWSIDRAARRARRCRLRRPLARHQRDDGAVAASRQLTRAALLPDTVGPGMRLLVCGLNPSLHAADAGVGFVRPGNRFWPAAIAAGVVTVAPRRTRAR